MHGGDGDGRRVHSCDGRQLSGDAATATGGAIKGLDGNGR